MAQKRPRPPQENGVISSTPQSSYTTVRNDTEQMMENSGQQHFAAALGTMASAAQTERFMSADQCTHQQIHQQKQEHLLQRLQSFWASQHKEIEKISEFRNHSLPLARIKRIMKADEDVRMISAEAPVVFAKACEMFILELTLRARYHTEESKRRTLQRNDIATAIAKTEIYDFLVDIIPREDQKDEAFSPMATNALPLRAPTDFTADYYLQDQQSPFSRAPEIDITKSLRDPNMYAPQFHPFMGPHLWLQTAQQPESPGDS